MNLRNTVIHFFAVLMLFPAYSFGQSNDDIMKYLESTLNHNYSYAHNGAFNQISSLELIEARIEVNFDDHEYGGPVISSFLLKNSSGLKKIQSPAELITMPEFYQSIRKEFKLKIPEDGLVFQTALNIISQEERNEGFFKVGNKWYFIRSQFFGSYFIVETDNDGKFTKIKHTKGIETDIPDDVHYYSEIKTYEDFDLPVIDKSLEEQISKFLTESIEYRFEIEAGVSEYFSKISEAKLYEAKFILVEQYGDDRYESENLTKLITYNGNILSSSKIWESDLFLESTKPVFRLKTDADAKLFQDFLNEMEARIEDVRFYKEDEFYLFVRDESFGEENGYIVKTDPKGHIVRLTYSGFQEKDILRFRMQDPDFKVDYGFKCKKPEKTQFNYKKDDLDYSAGELGEWEYIEVEIEFNEQAVNAKGAWIMTRFNGENYGIFASTDMQSPFTDRIPVNEFGHGKHKIDFLLLPPGERADKPLGAVSLEVNIE